MKPSRSRLGSTTQQLYGKALPSLAATRYMEQCPDSVKMSCKSGSRNTYSFNQRPSLLTPTLAFGPFCKGLRRRPMTHETASKPPPRPTAPQTHRPTDRGPWSVNARTPNEITNAFIRAPINQGQCSERRGADLGGMGGGHRSVAHGRKA